MHRLALPALDVPPLSTAFGLLSCSDELVPADEGFPDRRLDACSIQVTVSGQAEATVGGRTFHHRPGRLFAIARGVRLSERALTPWRVRYVMLDGAWCEPLVASLAAVGGAVMLDRPPRGWVEAMTSAVAAGLDGGPGSTWRLASSLATLIGGLSGEPVGGGDLLADAGRLIDAAPERAWSVAALAIALRSRPRALQARLRGLTGEAAARWILRRRMEHARALLTRGVPVHRVAARLGFANPFHFSRAFKRCCGVPPSLLDGR